MRKTKNDLIIHPGVFDTFWDIISESFPESERRTKEDFKRQLNEKEFYINLILNETEKLLGFISWWDLGEYRFIEHFAVSNTERNRGLGTKIFSEFIQNKNFVILETEPPLNEISKRRIRFYKKFNFHVLPYNYYQPSYHKNREDVDMLIMTNIPKLSQEEFDLIRINIYKRVYNKDITN